MLSPNSASDAKSDKPVSPASKTTADTAPKSSAGLLSASFDKLLTSKGADSAEAPINPFMQRQSIRSRRVKKQQGSSRFINEQYKELEQLPPIKGKNCLNLPSHIESKEKQTNSRVRAWLIAFEKERISNRKISRSIPFSGVRR